MNNIWFTSDTHFSHRNIIKYYPETRGRFKDIEEMNEAIIEEWNKRIKPNDTIYHLGDVIFGNSQDAEKIIRRLNGKKILIAGNHDHKLLNDVKFINLWKSIRLEPYELKIDNRRIILFHFPMIDWNFRWEGSFHLHGHTHGKKLDGMTKCRRMDVGVDTRPQLSPWNWEEIKALLDKNPIS